MLKLPCLALGVALLAWLPVRSQTTEHTLNYYIAHAPFKMPALTEPHFNNKTFNIQDYGAIGDGQTLNSAAINKTIEVVNGLQELL